MPEPENLQMKAETASFRVLGVRVHAIQIPETIAQMEKWIELREFGHYVAVTGMHGVTEARDNPQFRNVLNSADLVVPDGMPLVWLGRLRRHPIKRRVYGPELMETFCAQTGARYRHFFYGGAPGVANNLAHSLQQRFGIMVAGTYTPPFRPLTPTEETEVQDKIRDAAPDVLWVGLSTPKQEQWMYAHRNVLQVPVMLGIGAAFDLSSGKLQQAPSWMRENGLEWLFRLAVEPKRLWKRYLVAIPGSMWSVSLELLHLRKFD
jgi:N-acetylglucosaminyldiphosphoundecaprenol N-acetyl-beta-D-mannosaminyltransferase